MKKSKTSFDTIVFSGGGIKGIAHLGAMQYINSKKLANGATTFIGTSAGAIVAAVMAVGLDPKEVFEKHIIPFKWKSDIDITLLDKGFGIDTGASLDTWLRGLFPKDITFKSLHTSTKKRLVVCVTNLNTRRAEYFGPDTTPDMSVLKALRMSCSVPLYFSAVHHEGMLYVDGGVCDNFPVHHAYDIGGKNVLGLQFYPHKKPEGFKWTVDAFMGAVLESSLSQRIPHQATILDLECGSTTQPLDFKLPENTQRFLFQTGFSQTAIFFKKTV